MTAPLTLAVSAWEVGQPETIEAWETRLDVVAEEAVAAGAELLLLPEYCAMELGPALAGRRDAAAELASVAGRFDQVLAAAARVAAARGLWLLPGSLPRLGRDGKVRNLAPLIAPDGRMVIQEKHVMTRFETDQWGVVSGAPPGVVETPWGRVGIAICYDAEFPSLVRAQVAAGAWLILVPACTDTRAGGMRVTLAARARAMENQCVVAVAPTVGEAPWSAALDTNHGIAAVYGPIDHGFQASGVIATGQADVPGLVIARLDPAAIAAVRVDGAVRNHRDWPADPPPARLLTP